MNKGTMMVLQIVALASAAAHGIGSWFDFGHGGSTSRSSTPHIGGGHSHRHHPRFRPHAPGDGRWHMKYHRSRG